MAELATWTTLARWITSLARFLPDKILRLVWSQQKLLGQIQAFHFDQAPRFYVGGERISGELSIVGFNVLNFSPFKFSIVGLDLRVSLDARDLIEHSVRLPSEIEALPYARSGFFFRHSLNDGQSKHLRDYGSDWAFIRVSGAMILKSVFGELRKDVSADVVALIDSGRPVRTSTKLPSAAGIER